MFSLQDVPKEMYPHSHSPQLSFEKEMWFNKHVGLRAPGRKEGGGGCLFLTGAMAPCVTLHTRRKLNHCGQHTSQTGPGWPASAGGPLSSPRGDQVYVGS